MDGRRNLPPYVRAKLALKMEATIAARAKVNQAAGGGGRKAGCQKSDKVVDPIDTKKELAKTAGVSHDTIAKVKRIEAKAAAKVDRGTVAITEGELKP